LTAFADGLNVATMDARGEDVPTLLGDLASELSSTLRRDLLAAYLYGSYLTGGYDAGVSDVDLIAVTRTEADRLDLEALERMHDGVVDRHPEWADRVEIVYVGERTLREFRTSTGRLAVISPGEPLHIRSEHAAEWVQNWYLARETGRALSGPPPSALIPPVSWSEFVAASRRYAGELARSSFDAFGPGSLAYAVLTMCRLERTIEVGDSVSKQTAAAWARRRHPESAQVIEAALECRFSHGTTGLSDQTTRSEAISLVRRIGLELGV
jgi:predicted nucleotidyltransferase